MGKAARAIIIEKNKFLVMHRNKYGSEYFTLVGGQVRENETLEQGLVREIKEETGLDIIEARLVFTEHHPAPYNEQYIYVCKIAPHGDIKVQDASEEGFMNRLDMNIHTPYWINLNSFATLNFRTPQLQQAILQAIKKGFPERAIELA